MSEQEFSKIVNYMKSNPNLSKSRALKNLGINQASYYNWAKKYKATFNKPTSHKTTTVTTNKTNKTTNLTEVIENVTKIASGLKFFGYTI